MTKFKKSYIALLTSLIVLNFPVYADSGQNINIKVKQTDFSKNMVKVNGGSFIMGSSEPEAYRWELPAHNVRLDDFYISKYEVSQKEYLSLVGNNPSYFNGENLPVERVSWFDAIKYCNLISEKEGLAVAYDLLTGNLVDEYGVFTLDTRKVKGYRLPTEAEWEFAARGGNKSKKYKYSGSDNIDEVGWYSENSLSQTFDIGMKKSNELNLHDMSGNVWEWCTDSYSVYSTDNMVNPYISKKVSGKVGRGGSWDSDIKDIRTSVRLFLKDSYNQDYIGFRIARTSD